jgi:hypothetical protein
MVDAAAARTRVRSPPHSLLPRLAGATPALPDSLAAPVAWRAGEPLMASSDARAPSTVVIQRLRAATADPSHGAQGYRRASMVDVMIPREPTRAQNTSAAVCSAIVIARFFMPREGGVSWRDSRTYPQTPTRCSRRPSRGGSVRAPSSTALDRGCAQHANRSSSHEHTDT